MDRSNEGKSAARPETLTMREAAQELRCCERTVWSLIQSGKLPALKLGRAVRIRRDALRHFLQEREGVGFDTRTAKGGV